MSCKTVSNDLQQICTWLGLQPGTWPPDHYTLLGLPSAEPDIERIEHQVHERLMRLRCYQLCNAVLATEAMTHLAKAFDCLTSPDRKKAYDAAHFPNIKPVPPPVSSARVPTVIDSDTAETPAVPSAPSTIKKAAPAWKTQAAPPPVRSPKESAKPSMPPVRSPQVAAEAGPVLANGALEPPPVRLAAQNAADIPNGTVVSDSPSDMSLPSANSTTDSGSYKVSPTYLSPEAVQLLGTRRDLFECVLWARRVTRAWQRAGKYLSKPERRLTKSGEGAELTRLLRRLDDMVQEAPGLLGEPGQPGYRVLALANQDPVVERFKSLDPGQREALAQDFKAGALLLEEYREHLMEEIKGHRRLNSWQRGCRAADAVLTENLIWVFLLLALIVGLILAAVWFW